MEMRQMGIKIPEAIFTRMMHYKAETKKSHGEIVTEALQMLFGLKDNVVETQEPTSNEPEVEIVEDVADELELGAEKVD